MSMQDTPLIQLDNVSLSKFDRPILSSISFKLSRKEIVTIIGPNGAGKSTLLKSLIDTVKPHSGSITKAKKLKIGYVPQKLHIDSQLPLNVSRFLELIPAKDSEWRAWCIENCGVEKLLPQHVSELSGGEFQRVLLCRAILHKPDLLILDEPTQGLDHLGTMAFYQQIELFREALGCGVLLVSHELHVVMRASDRVICLNGHICCQGTPQQVVNDPEYLALLGSDAEQVMAIYRHEHDHHHDHDQFHHNHHH